MFESQDNHERPLDIEFPVGADEATKQMLRFAVLKGNRELADRILQDEDNKYPAIKQ